ncbi:methyltransferase domain-containing protein [Pseudothauera nasutitermitis]|uniref:Methyltransferase domain-containing protein n=1 Tax=Pseudothauera nasutitermitis TaxID=2565930 RepID=A0A4V6RX96_9RHOO|nr:methyltransferase domain-containing protein [Pseudothauera nasutitermitis]
MAYPAIFHRELTPAWLRATATALGYRSPDPGEAYTWCELGCGPGLGTLLTAAANPDGRFIAVDFDPAAIVRARALAEEAGIGNARFLHMSFAELAEAADTALPPLDFIVLHGVLSWISPANRQAVMRIVARWLKPGGIACLSYMSQPGSAPMMAAQRVLQRSARISGAGAGLPGGLALLRALRDGGAGQFVVVPELGDQIEQLTLQPSGYLAHEFLGEHWEPLHVADVLGAMAATGCTFLGSATPLENIDAVSIPGGAQPVVAAIEDVALRETAKDIARNQTLRRDLYQRGARPLAPAEHRAALEAQRFIALPGAPGGGALRFSTRIGPVDGPAAMFSPLLEALAGGSPVSFGDLLRLPAYAGRGGLLNQACQMLLWAGYLHPWLPAQGIDAALSLNRALWRGAAAGEEYAWVVAPAIGSAIPADRPAMLAAHALDGGRPVDARALAAFERELLPVWKRLGVLGNFD